MDNQYIVEKRKMNSMAIAFSGIEDHALAPLSNRLGAFIFRHGEHFYNLQGLRRYKEKFDPVWEGRYLASPGGLKVSQISPGNGREQTIFLLVGIRLM